MPQAVRQSRPEKQNLYPGPDNNKATPVALEFNIVCICEILDTGPDDSEATSLDLKSSTSSYR